LKICAVQSKLDVHTIRQGFPEGVGIATGEVEFDLEAAWMQFFYKNKHSGFSPCCFCGAQSYQQHTLDCPGGTPIIF
jgi:hypothetical protein